MAGITAAIIGGIGAIGAAGIGAYAANRASKAQKSAANAQVGVANQQMAMQKQMFEKQLALQEPFRRAGIAAQNRLLGYLGLPGGKAGGDFGLYNRDFTMADYQADPGYAFRMSEGIKALERSAAARGGLLSGTTLKGIERFGQNLASDEYQNAFNRYYAERQARLNPLQAFLGQGQMATNQMGSAAANTAQGMANTYGQMAQAAGNLGQARASGYVGMGNAAMGGFQGLGNIANQYATNQMMMQMFNPVQTATYGPGTSGFY